MPLVHLRENSNKIRIINMKKIFFILFTISFWGAYAQNRYTDTSATLVSYWKKGDIKRFEITEQSVTYKHDTLKEEKTDIDTILFLVKEETSKSYLIEWEYLGNSSTDKDNAVLKKINEKLSKKYGNMKLLYSTSESGTFQQIENWEKLSKAFGYAFDEAIKGEKKNSDMVRIFKQLKELYQTKQGIENIFNKYVNTYHYLYGLEFFKNNPYYFETTLPNTFGGDPFPANLAIRLDSVNTADEKAYISIKQSVDKDKARTNIKEIIEKLGGKKLEDNFFDKDDLFLINDKMKYTVSLPEGWVEKYEFIRTIKVDNVKKITKININLLD